ncbi:glycosyltransferase family 4 protein [Microcoleus sp. FACHB-1515]|uniref:glycosyltransferase family 4 protein n=1 Tax=Cyanophyceae TaxID=3028117 RepID=UPI001685AC1B|nr:glycosyltransferase family 4 protein [Microcoleus sp. FACHB-1515]MBD2089696.1 glycosyltransferase family 4 protein [Microcoleus sp. FACHB-1515]
MLEKTVRSLRVLYAAGPGNVLGTYRQWLNSQDDTSQVSVTYSSQFYNACRSLNAQGYVVAYPAEATVYEDEQFKIEHRPQATQGKSGIAYHLSYLWYGVRLVASALRWKADVVVVADGTTHWFVLRALPLLGVKIIPTIHCVLWSKYQPQTKLEKQITQLNRHLFAHSHQIMVASEDIAEQIKQITPNSPKLAEFLPLYRRSEFQEIAPPSIDRSPFNVLFVGRVEVDKGVFDLLEIAKRFAAEGRQDIHFHLCGVGTALEALQQAVAEAGLSETFICHGYCLKPQMQTQFSQSHVVIAPTTTQFIEGFCQVVAEGVLAGRPVVTSSVCPALAYVRPAAVEVQPDDVQGYGDALLKLCDDRAFYETKQQGCLEVQEQFYDWTRSWEATLKSALIAAHPMQPASNAVIPDSPASAQQ